MVFRRAFINCVEDEGEKQTVEEFLKQLMGKRVDISCGTGSVVRGDVVSVSDGLLFLRDEHERVAYVAIDKIGIVWEVKDQAVKPGFVGAK